jgi:hypothetical protein
MEPRKLTEAELLTANVMDLNESQIAQRSAIIKLRREERELTLIDHQNREFSQKQEAAESKAKAGRDAMLAEQDRIKAEQQGCRHMTGGEGRGGFFAGDGALYGSATSVQGLPTGEYYILCCRCQREFHDPSICSCGYLNRNPDFPTKRRVIEGKCTIADYDQAKREYVEALNWTRKSFGPLNGEYQTASTFRIPALEEQRRRDDAEFAALVQKGKR